MILRWIDVIKRANRGNPEPDRRVEKPETEWVQILTQEQFRITRAKGTEKAHSSEFCELFDPGIYSCICCGTPLFDSSTKFKTGSGWPSFDQPLQDNVIAYYKDKSLGMYRIEAVCNVCDAHLGHVFPDGPDPSGLRYCINSIALEKSESEFGKVTLGGGCFWCTEALFKSLKGVIKVESGYSGGKIANPTYTEVSSGRTGHAEVIQITYNPKLISFETLIEVHLSTHNPTLALDQGDAAKPQYRSIIFYLDPDERSLAESVIQSAQEHFDQKIITQLKEFEAFYKAEEKHQDYYSKNRDLPYCTRVIEPKLELLKKSFSKITG